MQKTTDITNQQPSIMDIFLKERGEEITMWIHKGLLIFFYLKNGSTVVMAG